MPTALRFSLISDTAGFLDEAWSQLGCQEAGHSEQWGTLSNTKFSEKGAETTDHFKSIFKTNLFPNYIYGQQNPKARFNNWSTLSLQC